MKKLRKVLVVTLLAIITVAMNTAVFASTNDLIKLVKEPQYSEDFKEWLELDTNQRSGLKMPMTFDLIESNYQSNNPINIVQSVGNTLESKFTLQDIIPENMVVRNQKNTNSCWAFASLGSLESHLALTNYYNDKEAKVYDLSERHMEYGVTRVFNNNEINKYGLDRELGQGGNYLISMGYLTNGLGAVEEKSMPFVNGLEKIDLSEIQNKEVVTTLYDTINFPKYKATDDLTSIKSKIKQHVKKYGAVEAGIHGAEILSDYYNNETGALYCDNETECPTNHDVIIVGWDDNFSKENFNESHRPKENGAWIVRNSWGTRQDVTMAEMKATIFKALKDECINKGWTEASMIPDSVANNVFVQLGYILTSEGCYLNVGKEGFMYVSYEDVNIHQTLSGVLKASDKKDYDYVYQYDEMGTTGILPLSVSTCYAASIFEKQSNDTEYITGVSLYAPETYSVTVYANENNNSVAQGDLTKVKLAEGDKETFTTGYHTVEFAEPLKITGDEFAIVVKITSTRQDAINVPIETKFANTIYDSVVLSNGKTFWTVEGSFEKNEWVDLSKLSSLTQGKISDADFVLKAYTIKEAEEEILESIEIKTPPTKTEYVEGQDFDKTGMIVEAIYSNETRKEITDYTIENGDDLQVGQTEVTIKYMGQKAIQKIKVKAKEADKPTTVDPVNSDFDKAKVIVNSAKAYYYTDKAKKGYIILDLTVKDIERDLITNDKFEYYYYLSGVASEKNITDWVKVSEIQYDEDKLEFDVDTRDIKNYAEVSKANKLYLYIKEVAKRDDSSKELVVDPLDVVTTNKIVVYKDDKLQKEEDTSNNNNNNDNKNDNNDDKNNNNNNDNNNNNNNNNNNDKNNNNNNNDNKDNTTSNNILPAAGTISIVALVIAISIGGVIALRKYKHLNF